MWDANAKRSSSLMVVSFCIMVARWKAPWVYRCSSALMIALIMIWKRGIKEEEMHTPLLSTVPPPPFLYLSRVLCECTCLYLAKGINNNLRLLWWPVDGHSESRAKLGGVVIWDVSAFQLTKPMCVWFPSNLRPNAFKKNHIYFLSLGKIFPSHSIKILLLT